MKIAFMTLFLVTATLQAASQKEVQEAKASIQGLIAPIIQKSSSNKSSTTTFTVKKCDKQKINWMDVILMRASRTLTYRFRPGCDIEGTITPAVFKPFPVDLKLKNLQNYHRLEAQNRITASLESKPVMQLNLTEGVLTGAKGTVKFEADYQVVMNPLKKENPIEKNLGGEIRITEIFGKKVFIKEKILVE